MTFVDDAGPCGGPFQKLATLRGKI